MSAASAREEHARAGNRECKGVRRTDAEEAAVECVEKPGAGDGQRAGHSHVDPELVDEGVVARRRWKRVDRPFERVGFAGG